METTDYIATLPPEQQKALSICGIYKAEQLTRIAVADLMKDYRQACNYFPEEMAALSERRLQSIYEDVVGTEVPEITPDVQPATPNIDELDANNKKITRQCPTLVLSSRARSRSSVRKSATANMGALHDKSHCIRCSRPLRVYVSALFTILFYLDLVAWVVVPLLFLMGILGGVNPYHVIYGLTALALPYFLLGSKGSCTVCNMNIFRLRKFPRNKYAHHLPLLGYNLTTALHIIFFFWFRCPSCGTPQTLLRRSSRR